MYTFKIMDNMTETQILNAMITAYIVSNGHFATELSTGETAEIRAYQYTPKHEDCEWFFVSGIEDAWADDDSLARLAKYFTNYASKKAELAEDKRKLELYEEKLAEISDKQSEEYREMFSFYSDWHKDLYGVRPKRII